MPTPYDHLVESAVDLGPDVLGDLIDEIESLRDEKLAMCCIRTAEGPITVSAQATCRYLTDDHDWAVAGRGPASAAGVGELVSVDTPHGMAIGRVESKNLPRQSQTTEAAKVRLECSVLRNDNARLTQQRDRLRHALSRQDSLLRKWVRLEQQKKQAIHRNDHALVVESGKEMEAVLASMLSLLENARPDVRGGAE